MTLCGSLLGDSGRTFLTATCAALFLAGCSSWSGVGADVSGVTIERLRGCKVILKQIAVVDGNDDPRVVETARVNAKCEVELDFKHDEAEAPDAQSESP